MIASQQTLGLSPYIELYEKLIPEDNLLKRINRLIDFSFVYSELKDKYSPTMGRRAIDPIILFKYLLIKIIYPASDRDLVEHSKYDLSYKYFLGLMPEDDVIDPSTLTKFRTLRLKDADLLNKLLGKTVNIAISKGFISTGTVIVDSTHTKSKYNAYSSLSSLKERSKDLQNILNTYKVEIDTSNISNQSSLSKVIDECRNMIEVVQKTQPVLSKYPSVLERINFLEEGINDSITRHEVSMDKDAKRGHKAEEISFFGYKTHIAMTSDRFITGAVITTGEKGDTNYLPQLVEQCVTNGICVDTVIGDTAYGSQKKVDLLEENNIKLIANVNPQITKSREDGFYMNKDAGMLVCPMGHISIGKREVMLEKAPSKKGTEYKFDKEICNTCSINKICQVYKLQKSSKGIVVRNISETLKKQLEFSKTPEFREKMKERYKIEAKNAELKNILGYDTADSFGLSNMEMQGALTIFVCNIKRILRMEEDKK